MKQEKTKKQKAGRRILWTVLMILSILVFVVCGILLGRQYIKQRKSQELYESLKEDYVADEKTPEPESEKEPEPEPEPDEEPDEEEPKREGLLKVDFSSLWQVNPDVYAWLDIPGTAISYPVLQHDKDDAYYLNHTIDYKEGRPGAIYSERSSATDLSGFVHILYGHNMRNGSMFADLHKFEDADFLAQNPEVFLYTPDQVYVYQIFAAVVTDDTHLMYKYNFGSETGKQKFLDDLYKKSDYRNQYVDGVEVTTEDHILTLSTCVYQEKDRRYLVNAVLTEVIDNP